MIQSPFKTHDPDTLIKVTGMIPPEVKAKITGICINRGVHNAAIALFYKALADDITQLGLTEYSDDNEQELFNRIRQRTAPLPTEQGNGPDDQAGTKTVRRASKPTKKKPSRVAKKATKRRRQTTKEK